jgi:transcriptional regulator with XRE-family HTH domain
MFTFVPSQESPDPDLATALRRLRSAQDATQEDIAFGAGLTPNSYGEIERGRANPGWTTVRRVAEALGVSLVELAEAVEEG